MASRSVEIVAATLVLVSSVLLAWPASSRAGEDTCPEPNDAFQEACLLGAGTGALGFISGAGDTDAYGVVALDFNTRITVELGERPAQYRVELANWNGDVIASSTGGSIDVVVPLPGLYYVFVDSPGGEYSDADPYSIGARFAYPTEPPPHEVQTRDKFVVAEKDTDTERIVRSGTYREWTLKKSGTPQEPAETGVSWSALRARAKAEIDAVDDFTAAIDTRMMQGSDGGFYYQFRRPVAGGPRAARDGYWVVVNPPKGVAKVLKSVRDQRTDLTPWVPSQAISASGGVNRTVIRMMDTTLNVNVNGEELIRLTDDTFKEGGAGHGVITWADPVTVRFDNLLLTVPGG